VLKSAGISELFDARVDGKVAEQLKLKGKPAPDTYLAAAEMLGVPAERAVVVEDAISGVKAGRNGGFGLVIGVARNGDGEELKKNGADIVVKDLKELMG
jgi:HAD superfamily hydrolase (TIGR01509 family)